MRHPDTTKLKPLWKWEAYIVYELDSERILRIRYAGDKYQWYASEQKLLSYLHLQSKLFPQMLEYDGIEDWWIYTRIRGVPVISIVSELTEKEKNVLTEEICIALEILHWIKKDTLLFLWYEDNRSAKHGGLQWLREDIGNKLVSFPENVLKNIYSYLDSLEIYNHPQATMTHGDVSLENIMVDPFTHKLSGIIDFSDGRIADLALDFDNLWCLSKYIWPHLSKNMAIYGDIDLLKKRADFYSKRRYLFSYLYNFKHKSKEDILNAFQVNLGLESV